MLLKLPDGDQIDQNMDCEGSESMVKLNEGSYDES